MAYEWRESTVAEEAQILLGFAFKSAEFATEPPGNRLVRGDNVKRGTLEWGGTARFWRPWIPELEKYVLRAGDIVVGMDGSRVGENFARVSKQDLPALLVQRVACLRARERLDQNFLRYLICNKEFTSYIKAVHTGTSIPHISGRQIGDYPILVPPLPEQRAIAHILGTLDDKIELNRRMNETLEAMARAFFKSWFVDFDPVRAKAEGRDPGLPKPLADLFPNSFEDSELGEIPKGWGTHALGDLLSLDKGLSYKGQFLTEHGVPMVNLGCFLGRGRFAEKAIKKYSGEYKSRHVVRPRDLVIANTDITQQREVIGSPALVPSQGNLSELIFSHHVFAARFHEGAEFWKMFVYFLLLQDDFRARAAGFATGTTVLALPRDAVLNLRYPGAPRALVAAFAEVALPILERDWKSTEESRTLAALRDALLPKLLSGELRVPAGIAAAAQGRPSRSSARAVRSAGVPSKERAHRV